MSLPLAGAPTRTRLRAASRSRPGSGSARPSRAASSSSATTRGWAGAGCGEGFSRPQEPTAVALDRFYDLLLETGERRHFAFGPRASFVGWWTAALAGRPPRLPRGARRPAATRSPGSSCTATAAAVDRPLRRPRGGPARPPGRAPPAPLAGDPARDPRGTRRDGPRRRRRGRGAPRAARGRRRCSACTSTRSRSGRSGSSSTGAHETVVRPTATGGGTSRLCGARRRGRRRDRRPGRMSERDGDRDDRRALAAAEPREPRPLGVALERLTARRAPLGARDGGQAIGPAALATVEVRGLSDDTRAVRPGSLFVAIAGAPRRRPRPAPRGGGRRRGGRARRARRPGRPAAADRRRLDPAGARGGRGVVVRRPVPRAGDRRDHRHGRQDDDLVPRRRGARGRRPLDRARSGRSRRRSAGCARPTPST